MLEPLAAYELDLIQQSFDAAARLYPVFKGVPVAELIKQKESRARLTRISSQRKRNAL